MVMLVISYVASKQTLFADQVDPPATGYIVSGYSTRYPDDLAVRQLNRSEGQREAVYGARFVGLGESHRLLFVLQQLKKEFTTLIVNRFRIDCHKFTFLNQVHYFASHPVSRP